MKHNTISIKSDLGGLSNPLEFNNPVNIDGYDKSTLIDCLCAMLRVRLAEETIADMAESGEAKCPVHLAIGQEAISVGLATNLRKTDRGFGNHRSHGHYLAMGGEARKLFAEVLGKATGCSHGFGGSMHLYGKDVGFYGSVPIVAGTIPLAVGAGIAAKFDGNGDVALAFFGDGACEEGVFHESLNMAAIMKLPVIFVVENNLFSSHLDINLRQPSDKISRFAEAARMNHYTIDGNNVCEVMDKTKKLVDKARANNEPALIEAVTYRWRGHVGPREDIDVGIRRSQEEINAWKKRDPIERLLISLIENGYYDREKLNSLVTEIKEEFAAMRSEVLKDPAPEEKTLMEYVYAS
ncbi:MAG: thiamine pyrophosphate-dependent dehydrogenase E1 component subunit alpha [Rickettsiales bacterium]